MQVAHAGVYIISYSFIVHLLVTPHPVKIGIHPTSFSSQRKTSESPGLCDSMDWGISLGWGDQLLLIE